MWTAWNLADAGARVVLLEADVCGHGPSGRNGGFCETLWSNLPSLRERFGDERALAAARAEPGPALIECPVEPRRMALGSGAWWDLGGAQEAESPRTRELAAAHAAGVSAQRFHG
jgi:glycine/D-amino acid oxidase-like deaminating enzyme